MSEWISGNRNLSSSEQEQNARTFYEFFKGRGWSSQAICAMLGNIQVESSINPGIWENLEPFAGGYGLVQWTPYTKYSEWASERGLSWENNGDAECLRIIYESENGLQWFSNPAAPIVDPPLSFEEFSKSELDPDVLANYFLWYYEHPEDTNQPQRGKNALAWFKLLDGGITNTQLILLTLRKRRRKSPFC